MWILFLAVTRSPPSVLEPYHQPLKNCLDSDNVCARVSTHRTFSTSTLFVETSLQVSLFYTDGLNDAGALSRTAYVMSLQLQASFSMWEIKIPFKKELHPAKEFFTTKKNDLQPANVNINNFWCRPDPTRPKPQRSDCQMFSQIIDCSRRGLKNNITALVWFHSISMVNSEK